MIRKTITATITVTSGICSISNKNHSSKKMEKMDWTLNLLSLGEDGLLFSCSPKYPM